MAKLSSADLLDAFSVAAEGDQHALRSGLQPLNSRLTAGALERNDRQQVLDFLR